MSSIFAPVSTKQYSDSSVSSDHGVRVNSDPHAGKAVNVAPQHDIDNTTGARHNERWHPKATPYRVMFILTTIVLGTAKAVLTQQGRSVAPVTLEWIMSVILVLIFHGTSNYDIEDRAPRYLSWFFTFDCTDVMRYFPSQFSVRQPPRTWNDSEIPAITDQRVPPVTLYHIVFSLTVISFGLSKAAMGYLGSSTAATWLDWVLGTILTTGLYLLGLYESNSSAPFFIEDRFRYVTSVGEALLVLVIMPMFCALTFLLSSILIISGIIALVFMGVRFIFCTVYSYLRP